MATRNQLHHSDETRAKIQTSQIINRLQDHMFGKIKLSKTQVQAAQILLKKVLPDLSQQDSNVNMNITPQVNIYPMNDRP